MAHETTRTVRLPALTTEMDSAELLDWLVTPGDEVREGDPLAEVTTDKVDMELEAPYDGVVGELLAEVGDVLEVGAPMTTITGAGGDTDLLGGLGLQDDEEPGEEPSGPPADTASAGEAASVAREDGGGAGASAPAGDEPAEPAPGGGVPAPPGVRRAAREAGVDLADVTPSGSRGQATLADVEEAAAAAATTSAPTPAPAAADAADAAEERAPARPRPPRPERRGMTDKELRRRRSVRAATARATTASQAIPQFTLFRTADLTERATRRGGVSWTTIIARSLAATLWRHPELNATWDDEAQTTVARDGVRIGMAVDTPTGLVVVTLGDPDRIAPTEADRQLRAAAARARDGKLLPEEMQGASSTVSNLGGFGVERFTALLVQPQASILSVGGVAERPAVVGGRLEPRLQVELGLTIDHRVADGADGARALDTLVTILEDG